MLYINRVSGWRNRKDDPADLSRKAFLELLLSVDLNMVPELPTNMKVLLPNATPLIFSDVPEVTLSQVAPLSVDLTLFPEFPTETKVLSPNRKLPSHYLNPYLLKFHCSSLKCYLSVWNQYPR